MIDEGYEVYVICDGVSSYRNIDRKAALKRMEEKGVILTTMSAVLHELLLSIKKPNVLEKINNSVQE